MAGGGCNEGNSKEDQKGSNLLFGVISPHLLRKIASTRHDFSHEKRGVQRGLSGVLEYSKRSTLKSFFETPGTGYDRG